MREAFAMQKLLTFFSAKNIGIFEELTSENLTKRYLTTALVLYNRAQNDKPFELYVFWSPDTESSIKLTFCEPV